MALSITKSAGITRGKPLLNATFTGFGGNNSFLAGFGGISKEKQQFWRWFKGRPELNSPVAARVDDTIKPVVFYTKDGRPLGRNKRIEAETFWQNNFMDERLKSIWFDALVTGDGFGYKAGLSKRQVRATLNKAISKLDLPEVLVKELRDEFLKKNIDEETRKTRVFDYIASSTMEVINDSTDILGYVQTVNSERRPFNKDEIVQFSLSNVDGRVDGYSPVASLSSELILLWFIKENMLAYMRNNGVPKKMFTLLDEMANSRNHQYLIQQLESFGAVQNRHGNLLLTGKIDVVDLEDKLKDMEYEKLAKYVTGNIAYALRVPASRLPYNLDGSAKSDAGGLAEAGYWSMIESDQRKIETLLNTQVFFAMGIQVKFEKKYKIDDLRETQAMSMRADAVQKMQSILAGIGKEISESKILNLMDLDEDDVEEKQMIDSFQQTNLRNQNMLNNQQLISQDRTMKSEKAKTAAINNPKGVAQDGN